MSLARHPLGQVLACALLVAFSLIAAKPAEAASRDELRDRFRERAPRLLKAKDAGQVGEGWDGYVAAVRDKDTDDDTRKLIEHENRDRRELYRQIAEREGGEGVTAAKIAERNRVRNYEKARPEHFVQTRGGEWVRKRDYRDSDGDRERGDGGGRRSRDRDGRDDSDRDRDRDGGGRRDRRD